MAGFEKATVGLFIWWSASNAFAASPGSVLSVTRFGVVETAERIEADARSRGLKVLARTDHAGMARREGYRLRPIQTLIIDHGSGGAPARLIVWQAKTGVTVVSVGERLGDEQDPLERDDRWHSLHGLARNRNATSA